MHINFSKQFKNRLYSFIIDIFSTYEDIENTYRITVHSVKISKIYSHHFFAKIPWKQLICEVLKMFSRIFFKCENIFAISTVWHIFIWKISRTFLQVRQWFAWWQYLVDEIVFHGILMWWFWFQVFSVDLKNQITEVTLFAHHVLVFWLFLLNDFFCDRKWDDVWFHEKLKKFGNFKKKLKISWNHI